MKCTLLIACFFLHFASSYARQDTVRTNDLLRNTLEYFIQDSSIVGEIDPDRCVLKIEYDFNSDGIPDIATTDSPNLCGNAGCDWSILLRHPGGYYVQIGLFFNDAGIFIQRRRPGISRIVTYHHMSAFEGSIQEYELSFSGIKDISEIPSDTSNWNKFLKMCHGKPSPLDVYSINILEYKKTRELLWKRGDSGH